MEVLPASTTRSWQLTKLPASLAKYRAASAISFANPVLFSGTERARLVCSLFIFLSFSSSVSVFALPEPPQNIGVAILSAVAVSIERSVLGDGSGGDDRHLLPR